MYNILNQIYFYNDLINKLKGISTRGSNQELEESERGTTSFISLFWFLFFYVPCKLVSAYSSPFIAFTWFFLKRANPNSW